MLNSGLGMEAGAEYQPHITDEKTEEETFSQGHPNSRVSWAVPCPASHSVGRGWGARRRRWVGIEVRGVATGAGHPKALVYECGQPQSWNLNFKIIVTSVSFLLPLSFKGHWCSCFISK